MAFLYIHIHTRRYWPVTLRCALYSKNMDSASSELHKLTACVSVNVHRRTKGTSRLYSDFSPGCGMWAIVFFFILFSSVQFSRSVVSDSLRPHESKHARTPCSSPTPELTETHVHRVSDAIQPSHPLSSPSPPAPNPSQHQSLFQ